MFKVDNRRILISRGDTAVLTFVSTGRTLTPDDAVMMTVQNKRFGSIFRKVQIPDSEGKTMFAFMNQETVHWNTGEYDWDIRVVLDAAMQNGEIIGGRDVTTPFPGDKFIVQRTVGDVYLNTEQTAEGVNSASLGLEVNEQAEEVTFNVSAASGDALTVDWANILNKPSTYPPSAHTHSPSQVGADPSGTAASAVAVHNKDSAAHEDIRKSIEDLKNSGSGTGGGSSVEVDTTLTQSGKAADAKATGDAIDALKEANAKQDNRLIVLENASGIVTFEPASDDVPKVFFDEAVPKTKDYVVTKFRYISKTMDVSGYAEFKAQGNSSMNYPKKNMTVKLYADEGLTKKLKLGFRDWGAQSKFVLKANWIDITHSRNVVGARLWTQICETRKDSLPQLLQDAPKLGSVDGFPIKVYSQGIYQGRYSWNIPKDKWAFNMDDALDEHVVLCGESNNANTASVYAASSDTINGTYWTDEIHDTVPASVVTAWNRVLKFVNESTDEEFAANINSYINVDSVIDYLIFHVLFGNTDAYGKNQLLISYDLMNWYISAYDMDQFCGLDWLGNLAYSYDATHPVTVAKYNNLILKTLRCFPDRITERYAELRAGILSVENVINEFERWTDICPTELVVEDYASTTADGAFIGIPTKADANNIQQIRGWIVKRFNLYDGLTPYFGIVDESIPCTGITLDQSTLTFEEAGDQTLTATVTPSDTTDNVTWVSDNTSVATVSGGIVTAKANGSATITATCGAYSATCEVSVSGIEVIVEQNGSVLIIPDGAAVSAVQDSTTLTIS